MEVLDLVSGLEVEVADLRDTSRVEVASFPDWRSHCQTQLTCWRLVQVGSVQDKLHCF